MATVRGNVASHDVVLVVLVIRSWLKVRRTSGKAIDCVVLTGVDADLHPSEDTIADIVAEVQVLGEGVVALIGLDDGPHVFVVGGDVDGVGVVRIGGLDGAAQVLGVEELADVGHGLVEDGDGTVFQEARAGVREQVGVGGPAVVVTGNDGLEVDDAVVVGQLDAAEVGGVDTVRGVVARDGDARVDTGGVRAPDVDGDGGNGRAGADVDVLHLEVQVDTVGVLGLLHVGAEVLALDIVGTGGDLRGQDARGVGLEDGLQRSEHVVVADPGVVVVYCLPLLKGSQVTAVLLGVGLDATGLPDSLHFLGAALDSTLLGAAGDGGVATLRKCPGTNGSVNIADVDVALDVVVVVLLAGVGDDTGNQGDAGGDLGKGNHLDEGIKNMNL